MSQLFEKHTHFRRASRASCCVALALGASGCNTENHAQRGREKPSLFASARQADPPRVGEGRPSGTERPQSNPLGEKTSPVLYLSGAELLEMLPRMGGRGTVVNVWATWCGPCREELPMLVAESKRLASAGLGLLLVSVDEKEGEAKVPKMLAEYGLPPPYYIAKRPLGEFKRALHPVWPGNVPVSFLFDASVKRRYFWGGPVERKEIAPILDGFVAGREIDGETLFQLAPGKTME